MEWLQATLLGLVQGLTEFMPVSPSAHLRVVPALLGWPDPGAAFTAVTQLGTEWGTTLVVFGLVLAVAGRLARNTSPVSKLTTGTPFGSR